MVNIPVIPGLFRYSRVMRDQAALCPGWEEVECGSEVNVVNSALVTRRREVRLPGSWPRLLTKSGKRCKSGLNLSETRE